VCRVKAGNTASLLVNHKKMATYWRAALESIWRLSHRYAIRPTARLAKVLAANRPFSPNSQRPAKASGKNTNITRVEEIITPGSGRPEPLNPAFTDITIP
jgi:hypothetical protein